jgi:ABC-type uncharacterized transport system YnjBCD ATPase subunit
MNWRWHRRKAVHATGRHAVYRLTHDGGLQSSIMRIPSTIRGGLAIVSRVAVSEALMSIRFVVLSDPFTGRIIGISSLTVTMVVLMHRAAT